MPWKDQSIMQARVHFLDDHAAGLLTMTELCHKHGISRTTGYKWLGRHRAGESLADRSRAPHRCPHATPEPLRQMILASRRRHPTWGPDKICRVLQRRHPDLNWPSATAMGNLFRKHGLSQPGPARRRRHGDAPRVRVQAQAANDVWTCDFKGEFRMGNGRLCYPLTAADLHSRFLLDCRGLPSTGAVGAWPVFEWLFAEYGLPAAILTDNGVPFASPGFGGLSRLSVWWMRLGIVPMTIQPGRPQHNGCHERMHRTLKTETARPPGEDMADQQTKFDAFREEYNHERPHGGLDHDCPCEHYERSPRGWPGRLPDPVYPGHFERRRVRHNGEMKLKGGRWYLSKALTGQILGLEEIDEDVWTIHLDRFVLAKLNVRTGEISPQRRSSRWPATVALRAPCAGQHDE